MESYEFTAAAPVWAAGRGKDMNETVCFIEKFPFCENAELKIAACNFYRVFLNGEFLGFGPARAAENYYRTDVYSLNGLKEENTLFLEANVYNCDTLCTVRAEGFVQYELTSAGRVIFSSGKNTRCSLFVPRTQKTIRFSFQRAFTEDYDFPAPIGEVYAGKCAFDVLPCESLPQKRYLPRGVDAPTYETVNMRLTESGTYCVKDDYTVCRSRYMTNGRIGIYPLCDIAFNVNDFLCSLGYERERPTNTVCEGGYSLFRTDGTRTGFLFADFTAECDSEIILFFDELDLREKKDGGSPAEICFYRNSSQNYVRLKVRAGRQKFMSFEPYAAQYLKILVRAGKIEVHGAGIVAYERTCGKDISFAGDRKLGRIIFAALSTFRQNALDLLTDCPSRERAGWLCDGYFTGRAEKFFTGKNEAERNFLENYALAAQNPHIPENMIDMCYPSSGCDNFIENWALFYILELEDYCRRTGDVTLAKLSASKVNGLLEYFAAKENEFGLLENASGWVFVEWSRANDKKFTEGVNFPSNMLYAAALESAGRLYGGDMAQKAGNLRGRIREFSFNGEFFEDNCVRENGVLVRKGHTSETCQYYAFYFGTADRDRYPALYEKLFDKFGPARKDTYCPRVYRSNMFIGRYLRLDFLRREGRYAQVLKESVEYFYKMAKETGTLWEHSSPSASLCHGFASYIGEIIYDCAVALGGK